jgi:hypothetical protein
MATSAARHRQIVASVLLWPRGHGVVAREATAMVVMGVRRLPASHFCVCENIDALAGRRLNILSTRLGLSKSGAGRRGEGWDGRQIVGTRQLEFRHQGLVL